MLTTNQKLIELSAEKTDVLHRAQVALDTKGPKSSEYKSLIASAQTIQEDLDMLNLIERKMPLPPSPSPVTAMPAVIQESSATERARINNAYRSVLRNGRKPEYVEQRDLATTSDSTGAALVPQGFDRDWVEALKQSIGIDALVHSYNTGDSFKPIKTVQVDTTSTNLAYVPEIASTTSSGAVQTPAVKSQIQGADNLVLRTQISWNELDDSFDVLAWLKRSIAPVVSRGLSWSLLTGTDASTSTALPNSPTGGLTAFAPTGITQAAIADGITYANLIALRSGLSYAYQFTPNSGFVGSESVANYLAAQLNTIGEPLYKRDPKTNLLLIDGSPLYVAQAGSMPAYNAASSNAVVFAAFDRAFAFALTNPRFQVLEINPQQLTSDVIIRLRFGSVGLFASAATAFTTAAS
jgi:HK97 family phage major capsid protein